VAADEIFNLSGQSSITLSFAQPAEALMGNALGTLNMLETGLTLGNTMSDVPGSCMGPKPATSQARPSAPNETAPSSFWQMISQDRASHDNPQR
jgi:GDPmannose 4,6-dehydratase